MGKIKINRFVLEGIFIAMVASGFYARADSIVQEAESGTLGSDFINSTEGGFQFILISTDGTGSNPGSAARMATYSVTFPAAGNYDLYDRICGGPMAFNDDSMFYANGFGGKSPTLDTTRIHLILCSTMPGLHRWRRDARRQLDGRQRDIHGREMNIEDVTPLSITGKLNLIACH